MSIKKMLNFHWVAKFVNGEIYQFDGDNEIHHFGHVWGRKALYNPKDLVEFQLISILDPNIVYSVNFKDGVFNLNGEIVRPQFDFAVSPDKILADMSEVKIKPIFWMRTRQHLFGDKGTIIRYLFGYEIFYHGSIVKKIYCVNESGEHYEIGLNHPEHASITAAVGDYINLK